MDRIEFINGAKAIASDQTTRLAKMGFTGQAGQIKRITDAAGHVTLFIGTAGPLDFWTGATACQKGHDLKTVMVNNPEGLTPEQQQDFALSWLLESYRYGAFKAAKASPPSLEGLSPNTETYARAAGIGLTRDLINTPANHMRPADLAREAEDLAHVHGARLSIVEGPALSQGFPLIHAVGRAAGDGANAPRLIDMTWGKAGPRLTLVGKGISFDTGGLNLKPANAMRLMKKDMGGAAHALGLAHMVMALKLPLRLRVLIPTAENAVGPDAFRPGDVLTARAGHSVEIDNTDAEGRLVLADALAYAQEGTGADLILTLATLTGAARVALGPHIAPYFSNDSQLMWKLLDASDAEVDPLWPLPLYKPYNAYLKSDVADVVNAGGGGFAGAITAALFLERFVGKTKWAHFDIYGWNPEAKPGRPKGGSAYGLLSLLTFLQAWAHG